MHIPTHVPPPRTPTDAGSHGLAPADVYVGMDAYAFARRGRAGVRRVCGGCGCCRWSCFALILTNSSKRVPLHAKFGGTPKVQTHFELRLQLMDGASPPATPVAVDANSGDEAVPGPPPGTGTFVWVRVGVRMRGFFF